MDKTYEIFRHGMMTSVKIKDHAYDNVEFTVSKRITDDNGKEIVNSGYTMFFSSREFKEFFAPIVNDIKERIDNGNQP